MTRTPFVASELPVVLSVAFAEVVRSSVKLTFVGPEFEAVEQLSITAAGNKDKPQRANVFFKNSFRSIFLVRFL